MNLPQNPIFIVGYPRSGTTLLQRILATQPGLYTFPETHYFCVIEKKIQWGTDLQTIPPEALDAVFKNIENKMELRLPDAQQKLLYRRAADRTLRSKTLFETIVNHYLEVLYPELSGVSSFRWIEKTPNHAHFLDRIIAFYPQAQVLHILRHPVPAIYSRKRKFPFNRETPVVELARRWMRMLLDVEQFKEKHSDVVLTLRYEDLVLNMKDVLLSIAGFLKISPDLKGVEQLKQGRKQSTESFILSSETWKLEDLGGKLDITNHAYSDLIGVDETAAIEAVTGENMIRYGYEPFGAQKI